jgi:ribosome biogenesis protein NSA1
MRLCDFHIGPGQTSFAYGGDEVDLSLWDAERAFSSPSSAHTSIAQGSSQPEKKRKKPSSNDLLAGEVWRAKNVRTSGVPAPDSGPEHFYSFQTTIWS